MARQIFVNLPVKDLNRAIEFYTGLGFTLNPQFTDAKAACMVISDTIYVMLLTEPFFKSFTPKEISDATRTTEVLLALSADSREEVDTLVQKALTAGGRAPVPKQDHGWMYSHSLEDLDGHIWEVVWMDEAAFQQQQQSAGTEQAPA